MSDVGTSTMNVVVCAGVTGPGFSLFTDTCARQYLKRDNKGTVWNH